MNLLALFSPLRLFVLSGIVILLLFGLSACGVKGDPRPVDEAGNPVTFERNSYPPAD